MEPQSSFIISPFSLSIHSSAVWLLPMQWPPGYQIWWTRFCHYLTFLNSLLLLASPLLDFFCPSGGFFSVLATSSLSSTCLLSQYEIFSFHTFSSYTSPRWYYLLVQTPSWCLFRWLPILMMLKFLLDKKDDDLTCISSCPKENPSFPTPFITYFNHFLSSDLCPKPGSHL